MYIIIVLSTKRNNFRSKRKLLSTETTNVYNKSILNKRLEIIIMYTNILYSFALYVILLLY